MKTPLQQPDSSPKRTRFSSGAFFVGLLVSLLAVEGYVLSRVGMPVHFTSAPESPPPMADELAVRRAGYNPRHDLVVGQQAPEIVFRTAENKPIRLNSFRGRRVALIFLDFCASCATHEAYRVWEELQGQFPKDTVLLVTQDTPQELTKAKRSYNYMPTVKLLSDPNKQGAKQWNASWKPRVYALNERGHLTYIQPMTVLDNDAINQIYKLWDGNKK